MIKIVRKQLVNNNLLANYLGLNILKMIFNTADNAGIGF